MNKKFNKLRELYPTFIYKSYNIDIKDNQYYIQYKFEIPGLVTFNPIIQIPIGNNVNDDYLNYLIFNVGMVELVSYLKCTCSPNVIIEADYLDNEQLEWFKKLYYYGLGEFLYTNGIEINYESFLNIKCIHNIKNIPDIDYHGSGNLVLVGGGKDSNVTLEILKKMDNTCLVLNPKQVHIECCKAGGYKEPLCINRTIDPKLIELNKQGFLNGHTPFSALLAFISYTVAYIHNKKYIVLSNEASANESTVIGTNINHQYSKTYEFENDFNEYTKKYFNIDIKYFSLLRPLNEVQIAMLFSHYKKYHQIFKSCNIGSKSLPWKWCGKCAKCLFVYIILSPYLYKDKLVAIFGSDLYEDETLLDIFKELLGYASTKPFECVGTYREVRYAVSLLIKKLDNLPYLLQYYKDNYPLELDHKYELDFNKINNLDDIFIRKLNSEMSKYV